MKKIVLFALAGIMLLAFTKCSTKTQAFKDAKAIYDKTEKAINDAKTCEDLEEAAKLMFMGVASLSDKEYAEDEKATEDEKEELNKQLEEFANVMKAKELEFGCN